MPFVNGARVTPNTERLRIRSLEREARTWPVMPDPVALTIARASPKKGWAKRFLRKHRFAINGSLK